MAVRVSASHTSTFILWLKMLMYEEAEEMMMMTFHVLLYQVSRSHMLRFCIVYPHKLTLDLAHIGGMMCGLGVEALVECRECDRGL